MAKPVIGLALGSGAARGLAHIGIIEALEAEGIRPDIVAGCSIGAFVGAAYVSGRLEAMREWAESLVWHDVAGLLDVSLTGGGLIGGKPVEKLLRTLEITAPIEDLDRPFATVATDYASGREEWFTSGPIGKAVRASISLPGIFSPVKIAGDWYVDGGLVNPVPVSTCRALGANFVIAVNLNGDLVGRRAVPEPDSDDTANRNEMVEQAISALPVSWRDGTRQAVTEFLKPKPKTPSYFEVLANSINIMQDRITRSRLAGEPPHVMITPRLSDMSIFAFDQAAEAIEEGRSCARYAMPEIQRALANRGHKSVT
ncbi:MAG: patatin [Hyphomicrobiales bacterium]|nr:MAG: patatin [Hyphomicrobiales bacterium]